MEVFHLIIETTAESDLRGILRDIAGTLKAPETARRIYLSIKEQIMTLDRMPLRCPLVRDETFAVRELRRLLVENYSVFYVADERRCEVHILRVLYNRREWQTLL